MWSSLLNTYLAGHFSSRLLRITRRTMCEMARVFVRSVEDEDRLQISFKYHPDGQQSSAALRVYNFDRLKAEGFYEASARSHL